MPSPSQSLLRAAPVIEGIWESLALTPENISIRCAAIIQHEKDYLTNIQNEIVDLKEESAKLFITTGIAFKPTTLGSTEDLAKSLRFSVAKAKKELQRLELEADYFSDELTKLASKHGLSGQNYRIPGHCEGLVALSHGHSVRAELDEFILTQQGFIACLLPTIAQLKHTLGHELRFGCSPQSGEDFILLPDCTLTHTFLHNHELYLRNDQSQLSNEFVFCLRDLVTYYNQAIGRCYSNSILPPEAATRLNNIVNGIHQPNGNCAMSCYGSSSSRSPIRRRRYRDDSRQRSRSRRRSHINGLQGHWRDKAGFSYFVKNYIVYRSEGNKKYDLHCIGGDILWGDQRKYRLVDCIGNQDHLDEVSWLDVLVNKVMWKWTRPR